MESSLTVLKELRKERKMTQAELAKIMNVSQEAISCWERGKRDPSCEDLKKLADIFNVTLDYLLSRNKEFHCSNLSNEQKKLLNEFNGLDKPHQQIILSTISAFLTQQAAKIFENVINNNNNNGSGTMNVNNNGLMA